MSTFRIFFAWQSVRRGRNLIRRALDRAIERLHADASVEDAIRVDQDTEGVPGGPEVTVTILTKIRGCDVVLADVTFVATNATGRPVPNPNVMTPGFLGGLYGPDDEPPPPAMLSPTNHPYEIGMRHGERSTYAANAAMVGAVEYDQAVRDHTFRLFVLPAWFHA